MKLPDTGLAPALPSSLQALRFWLDVAKAVEEANSLGVFHCDVNPWNLLIADGGGQGCLVDWACSAKQRAPKLQRRGDFQAEELLQGDVGPHTDVYGASREMEKPFLRSRESRNR